MTANRGAIVLLVDEYVPESRRNHAKMMHHLALELRTRGYEVIVIAPSNCSMSSPALFETIEGIKVLRIRSSSLRGRGNFRRALAESLLPFHTVRVLMSGILTERVALCVNYSPSIFGGLLLSGLRVKVRKLI